MPKRGENIYKRKDGRWEGRYIKERVNGKARYGAVYASSYREVKEKLNNAKMSAASGNTGQMNTGKLSDISDEWLVEAASTLKESSIIKYENMLRCYILPEFGDRNLSEITNEQLIQFSNMLLLQGGVKRQGLAPSTVLEIMSIINSIRTNALRKNCQVSFSPECISIKRERKEIRVFSLDEEERLISYLYANMNYISLGILLCLFTGIRIGEVCALNWDDFCLEDQTLHIKKTMQRLRASGNSEKKTEVRILQPKSSSSIRIIPLPESIMKPLQENYTGGTFFLTCKANHFVEPRTMQNHFKSILEKCGIKNANFHATRHTFATRCIELGFDAKSLSEILGHASVAVTMNRYVHPSMNLKRENMEKLSELFAVK